MKMKEIFLGKKKSSQKVGLLFFLENTYYRKTNTFTNIVKESYLN